MSERDRENARRGWWNGVNVIVRDSEDILSRMFPPTERDRTLYVNEHAVHSSRHGVLAPEATSLVSAIVSFRPVSALKQFTKLIIKARRARRELIGRHASMNTFSEELPAARVNRSLVENQ